MLEYYPGGDNGEDHTGVENDTVAEPVEEMQCTDAEQVEPPIGEVEVQCEAQVVVNEGDMQCEADVLKEVQCEATTEVL